MVKKGAKAIEEDFSDVPTLPELNSLIFTMLLEFKNNERKQQVYSKIKEHWASKVKVITKDDIIDYGKKKLTIAEDEDVNDVNKVAKAASEKLFEQFVTARREKRDRIAQLTEEAKANATEENPDPQPEIDPNEIDCYFHLPDYPKTYEEAAALNRNKYALSVIHLEERPTVIEKKTDPELDEEGNPIEGTEQVIMEEEQIPEANLISEEEIEAQKTFLSDLKLALKNSEKDSAIRTFVCIKKEYNHRIIEPTPVEDADPEAEIPEENKGFNSIEEIAKEVSETLEKTSKNLMKYKKFKLEANLIPLKVKKPEPESESRLEKEGEEEKEAEESKEAEKTIEKSKADKSKANKSKADKSKVAEEEPEPVEPEPVLEQTLPREWNSESYQAVVNDLPEDKKSIAGLLSACIINVCEELEKSNKILEEQQEMEEDDEYKYIFDDVLDGIASSQGFEERNIMSASESVFSKEAHKSMFSSAQRSRENWNQDVVLDSQDV